MRRKKQRPAPPPPATRRDKPAWHEFLDQEERPNREDLGAQHNVFIDSVLEPVPMGTPAN